MRGEKLFQEALILIDKVYSALKSKDRIQAEKLYALYIKQLRKAAYAGHANAQFEYALANEDIGTFGRNPNYNPKFCYYWYKKSCDQNHAGACNSLATYLENGYGTPQDDIKALELYKRAADLGDPLAKDNYRLQKKKLKR